MPQESRAAFSGSQITIPLSPAAKRPAGDLVYQGRPIDESEAGTLTRGGVELWQLNPTESQLWTDSALEMSDEAAQHFPPDGAVVHFDSNLASTKSIYRASIDSVEMGTGVVRPFTLSASLNASAALMRAAVLRRLGYQVSNPKIYRSLTVTFNDLEARDKFIENLADGSLTGRDRWLAEPVSKDLPQVRLHGVVLEPGRIQVQTMHWGLMKAAVQQDRRVFRALLLPDVLFDFAEKVNLFAWETGRIFNGALTLDYSLSDGFTDVTLDDLKWLGARLGKLSREELRLAVAQAGFPADIEAVMVEKVISRRNSLLRLLGLSALYPPLPFEADVNIGNISHGQLTSDGGESYKDYPQEFYKKAQLPPLRFSQLWRYAAIEGISAGIGQLLNQINTRLLTYESTKTAISDHQNAIKNGMSDYLLKHGSLNGYQQSTGFWGKPLAGATIDASRTVVAGTYLGSDSQVQLVDTLGINFGAGYYLGWDGAAPLLPGVASTVTLSRTYSHIKPVKDMNTALTTNWGHLVVAGFMRKLADTLNPDIVCSIPEGPWTSEFEAGGVKITKINYDSNRLNGKEEALEYRKKLITEGANPERIILQANDRDSDCKGDVETAVNKNLEGFTDELAVGDTFIITDAVKLGAAESVSIPITTILGQQASFTPSSNQGIEIARQTMIRRTKTGFQIYLQDHQLDSESVGLDFNFFINVLGVSAGLRHGKASTDFYNVDMETADSATKRKLVRSLKALLRANNSEVLVESFNPYTLKHDLLAKLAHFKFLLWSKDWTKQNHQVDIYPPLDPKGERNRGDYKRTLAMRREAVRTGTDVFGFLMGAVGKLTGGIVSLPGVGGDGGDPGNSPGGDSLTSSVSTQAEITDGKPFNPVTAVEQTYRGWLLSRKGAMKIFDSIEKVYGDIGSDPAPRGLFNRSEFNNTTTLQLYQIDTTLMFYPEALQKVKGWLLTDFTERGLFNHLTHLYGERKLQTYCDIAESQFGRHGPQIYHGVDVKGCAPDWVHALMEMRRSGFPLDKIAQLNWYNKAMSQLMGGADVARMLRLFDVKSYFFVTRVNGFRKNDVNGALEYLSDTVGRYDSDQGLGMYREFSSAYGISLYELYARYFTDGL